MKLEQLLRLLFIIHIRNKIPQTIDLKKVDEKFIKTLMKNLHTHGLTINELTVFTKSPYNDIQDIVKRGIFRDEKEYSRLKQIFIDLCRKYNSRFGNQNKIVIHSEESSEKPEIIKI